MKEKEFKTNISVAVKYKKISTYKMSQEGVNHNTYKRWIDNKGSISLKTALKLIELCDLKLEIKR